MNSQEDIRKTLTLLENIYSGRNQNLKEGFNPLTMDIGGTSLKGIIDKETADMTTEDKIHWWSEFLMPFLEGFELVELGKHLFGKHNSDQESLEESMLNESLFDMIKDAYRTETKDMTREDKANWLAKAIGGVAEAGVAIMAGEKLLKKDDEDRR